ncbi:MAG TPA: hypothetical protein VNK67_02895 [Burkholderiales bacterium]|nr:hypothetical protein [Burkholderiales bacterium]
MRTNEPPKFDPDGRDPALVATFRWLAETMGTEFDREAVPIGMTDAEWWRELLAAIEADPRSSGAAAIERNAQRPDYGMTSSQRWGLKQRKKRLQQRINATQADPEFQAFLKKAVKAATRGNDG